MDLIDRFRTRIAAVEALDSKLAEELRAVRTRATFSAAPEGFIPEAAGPMEFDQQLTVETIVLRTGRPVLAIVHDQPRLEFTEHESVVWKERLEGARGAVVAAARAVGRIEVQHHPRFEWLGTGWLVTDDTVVTNRHVAAEFARRSGEGFVFRMSPTGLEMRTSIDFLKEVDRLDSLTFRLVDVIHIEDDQGPDLALLRVERKDSPQLQPIRLARETAQKDELVAVIGYPARDSRIPEADLVTRIFGDVYERKRLAPGQVTGVSAATVLHDCSTLGGNSGSVVLSLRSGEAVGVHFAGRFLEANYAVPARVVAERLDAATRSQRCPPRPTSDATRGEGQGDVPSRAPRGSFSMTRVIPIRITVEIGDVAADHDADVVRQRRARPRPLDVSEDDDEWEIEARPEDYVGRNGYQPNFLDVSSEVPLPSVMRDAPDVLTFSLDGHTEHVLRYQNFSVVMSRSRRLCLYSAVNITGGLSRRGLRRPAWRRDPRIAADAQILKECYGNPPRFARGHMTRREDPIWGSEEDAMRGNADSMHVTNTVPQMQPFNAGVWFGLENYALEYARRDDMRISVITGPLLSHQDPERFGVKIPRSFWKVIAFVHDVTRELSATGYQMRQDDFLREEEFIFGQHETTQTSIAAIEEATGLSFSTLKEHDPFAEVPESLGTLLTDVRQIVFVSPNRR